MGVIEDSLFVNEDWSALVPAGSPEAAFGITPKDAKRRGLLPLEKGETLGEPEKILTSANLIEPTPEPDGDESTTEGESVEPEVKQAEPPTDKQAATPVNKAAAKPANKGAARKDT